MTVRLKNNAYRCEDKGSNTLRGGIRNYSHKTRLGGWVEELYRPDVPKSGFTTTRFLTTAAEQMLKGRNLTRKQFGAGLPERENPHYDFSKIFQPDKRQHSGTWSTISKEFHRGSESTKVKGFCSEFKMSVNKEISTKEGLDNYRKKWTLDSEHNRVNRFTTDKVHSQNKYVEKQYMVQNIRMLPGMPLFVEDVAKDIMKTENYSLQSLTDYMKGQSSADSLKFSFEEFKTNLKNYGVKANDKDLGFTCSYFDHNNSRTIDFDEFSKVLK